MLMIERRGEHYLVHFVQTDDRFSAFALPSQRFPDMQSLTGFLLHVLHPNFARNLGVSKRG
jgi:hypothetical protein